MLRRSPFWLAPWLVAGWLLAPAGLPGQAPPSQDDIDRAVRQLGDDDFQVREQATRFLWSAGKAAEPALRGALKSGDPEVARRARTLLDRFQWGIYPDTPPEIVALVDRYRTGDPGA